MVAIGAMAKNYKELLKTKEFSGIAMYVLHLKDDKLW